MSHPESAQVGAEIRARLEKLIQTLGFLPDGDERLRYLMSLGRKFPPMDEVLKTDDRLLPGCISRLWIEGGFEEGKCRFQMDADAAISKGIAAAVCGLYEGQTPADVLAVEPDFFAPAGLTSLISPNRVNALASLRRYIVERAVAASR